MSILVLTSDTLIATPAAGNIEYSSPIFTGTPIGTQRGIVPTQQYYRLNADLVGANVTTAQSIFGVGVTLSSSTVYEFEINVMLSKTAGATSHTLGMLFGGTATLFNIAYIANAYASTSSSSQNSYLPSISGYAITNSITGFMPAISSANLFTFFQMKGTVSINAGGTFIPQYQLSAAPGGAYSTLASSYIRINPLSASGAATNVGTWA
jgi:hypothetical protein